MTKENWLFGLLGLLLGIVLTAVYVNIAVNRHHSGMMRMMGMGNMAQMMEKAGNNPDVTDEHHDEAYDSRVMSHAMNEMMQGLESQTGDAFDKAFLEQMIIHHEGAIEMAGKAIKNGKHEEIKTMANDIISAQTKEISQMKQWQEQWYK